MSGSRKKTVILASGGTGGHLFPAIAIAEELSKKKLDLHLVTDLRCQKYLSDDLPCKTYIIDLHINSSSLLGKIRGIFQLIFACFSAMVLLRKLKPDIVVGFGGYPSFPTVMSSIILGIPIIINEQNGFLGKSNRFFAYFAKVIALSYEKITNVPECCKNKIIYVGDILRASILKLKKKESFRDKKLHLLILGGSQGARFFAKLIPESISRLVKLNPEIDIFVTQQADKSDHKNLSEHYNNLGIKCELSEFFYNISDIYEKSHLVIGRSGASTIAELSNIGLPAIFIPYPYAAEDHQYFNAKAIEDAGASWCYRQNDITSTILAEKLNELFMNRKLLEEASKKLLIRKSDGSVNLANTVLKIIE